MSKEEILERLLKSYKRYYDILTEDIPSPFAAIALFASHSEQYFLLKAAKVADIDSNEKVYFALLGEVNGDKLTELSEQAWNLGLADVTPNYGHRNSDVTLYVIADRTDESVAKAAKKLNYSKSYKHGIYGWSTFKLVTLDISSMCAAYNRQGRSLKSIVGNITKTTI